MAEVALTTPETIQLDVAASAAWLRDAAPTSIFTVGFCFGGRNSWLATAGGPRPRRRGRLLREPVSTATRPGPIARAPELKGPILALQAGRRPEHHREQNDEFDAALTAAGVEHEIVIYDGAPHSFFDRKQEEFQSASEDAWARVLAFIAARAGSP